MKKITPTGFTLVELLLVMGLFAILSAIGVINLIRPQTQASLDSTVNTIVADLRSQQLKAMAGEGASGLRVEANQYILFRGSSYNASDPTNFVVPNQPTVTLSTTLPSQQALFAQRSGELVGFTSGASTITVSNNGGESKTITLNLYGAVTVN